ncbi:cobalamin-dependent protein, partial [Eubacterium aggregans]|uniref:cobalamin-dependent protein n=1 Tax=Eubacterium aggregans TaxID=81409 RepID=UPI003F342B93
ILLATVKGDVHDIGKNILKVILENYGYQVVDLGKDVEAQTIAAAVAQDDIRLVGLSTLMIATVKNMGTTIALLRTQCPQVKVMVGGAFSTQNTPRPLGLITTVRMPGPGWKLPGWFLGNKK